MNKRMNCAQCSKYFYREKTLEVHMRQVHGIRKHACENCDSTFENSKVLRAHIETIHRRETDTRLENEEQNEVPDGSTEQI